MGRSQHAAASLLAGIDWLAGLDAGALAAFAALTEPFAAPAGTRLFAQNDHADGLYLLTHGSVAAVGRTPGDGHIELARIGPGGVLGEFCLLDGGRRSADAVVMEGCQGWRVDLVRFAGLLAAGDALAGAVAAALRRQVALRARALVDTLAAAAPPETPPALPVAAAVGAAQLAARLHSFPGFDRFDPLMWEALAAAGQGHAADRGTLLIAAGQAPAGLWIVLRGALQWQATDGMQLLVHGPGALVGGAPFVLGSGWDARLLVRETAELFCVPALPHQPGRLRQALSQMLGAALVRDQRRLTRVRARLTALEDA